jgi:hypothetical protein
MKDRISIPAAIIVAGLLVAGAIYASNVTKRTEIKDPAVIEQVASITQNPIEVSARAVSPEDFSIGSQNAPITFVGFWVIEATCSITADLLSQCVSLHYLRKWRRQQGDQQQ